MCIRDRGAGFEITSIPTEAGELAGDSLDLQRISDALDELATVNETLAELVDLHFFCGFSFAEIAALLDISERTVMRDWNKARLYPVSYTHLTLPTSDLV